MDEINAYVTTFVLKKKGDEKARERNKCGSRHVRDTVKWGIKENFKCKQT